MRNEAKPDIHQEISEIFSELTHQTSDSAIDRKTVNLSCEEVTCNGREKKGNSQKFADETPPTLPSRSGSPGIFY